MIQTSRKAIRRTMENLRLQMPKHLKSKELGLRQAAWLLAIIVIILESLAREQQSEEMSATACLKAS